MHVEKCDIFPKYLSPRVEKFVRYPKFGPLLVQSRMIHFCLFMSEEKIYFQKWKITPAVTHTIEAHEKEAKSFVQFRPNEIKWSTILHRFERPAIQVNRTNADVRTGFRLGREFLVKANFTFGQRFVEPGTAHVIQTLNVPLLFYLRDPDCRRLRKVRRDKGYFPREDLFLFDRRILLPSTCYRIPPGTGYVLYSTQKNFFTLDVVAEDYELGFESVDPVRTRVVKIEGMYDRPVQTPYVEDAQEEEEEKENRAALGTLNEEDLRNLDFHSSYLGSESADARSSDPVEPANFESGSLENFSNFRAPEPVQTFLLITNPPIERSVVVAHPDFVGSFQKMKCGEYGDPRVALRVSDVPSEPLDLTVPRFEEGSDLETLIQSDPQNIAAVNRLIEDLCSPQA